AAETLYLIARYFGWETVVHRYGPYTQDPVVTQLAEAVRRAFATSDAGLPVGPFNFYRPEQRALGKVVMHRMTGQYGVEFGFLLDSRVVNVAMVYNPTFVIRSSLKPFFFNSLKNELCLSDNMGA